MNGSVFYSDYKDIQLSSLVGGLPELVAEHSRRYPGIDVEIVDDWLRSLVATLQQPGVGAATGYRWHLPRGGGFWPTVLGAWNSVIAGGFGNGDMRFCWGGATAIRRQTFEEAKVRDYWHGAVSDEGDAVVCQACGRSYPVREIPIMLVEESSGGD